MTILKKGTFEGQTAIVSDADWNGMVKVSLDGATKSYEPEMLQRVTSKHEEKKKVPPGMTTACPSSPAA